MRPWIAFLSILFLILPAFFAPVEAGQVTLIINFPSISPNDDGVKDSMTAAMTLAGAVDTLLVTIETLAMTEVLDTIYQETGWPAGQYSAIWDGRDHTGTLLPEGEYLLRLYEYSGGTGEYQQRTVVIDLTPPSVNIDRIEPGVFSPGFPTDSSTVAVYYMVSLFETGSATFITITDPEETSWTTALEVTADGEYLYEWLPADDVLPGLHLLAIDITDVAGNTATASGAALIDTGSPEITLLTVIEAETRTVPLDITGYCHDPAGIQTGSLKMAWGQFDTEDVYYESDYLAPDSSWYQVDTLYWRFDVPDTVNGTVSWFENQYTLNIKCSDNYNQLSLRPVKFTLDRTSPAPPLILNRPGTVLTSPIELELEFAEDVDSLIIFRSYESTVTNTTIASYMPSTVELGTGQNLIWVVAKDVAGNESGSSEILDVTYSLGTGISYPEAFRGPDVFHIVTDSAASGVEIDIYDLGGEKVRTLRDWSISSAYEIEWDLLNDDGETVRNGAYLMVMTIHSGGSRTIEKNFIAVVK
ncbi:MAG: hypothetical protein KAV42_03705 [Candidatus Krumholzibacteria bacterium]|nr:hypothetical protein [Candidatus Krumholzibacteria bacterium]